MNQQREVPRIVVGAVAGAIVGIIFGAITAFGAAHGDPNIRSGLSAPVVFLLAFVGWTLSALVITDRWKYAHDERSANWIGIISVIPVVVAHFLIASSRSELFSFFELIVFVGIDVIVGIAVGELGWKHFGELLSEADDSIHDRRE